MSALRLTIINQFYKPDLAPTGHLAASLAEHLAVQGHTITVVTSLGGYVQASPLERVQPSSNPRLIRLWTPRLGKRRTITRIIDYASFYIQAAIQLLLLPGQDVIISMTTPPFIAWAGALHKAIHRNSKLVLWNMDSYPEILERTGVIEEGSFLARALRRINRALFRRLDYLICLDDAMCSLLTDHYLPDGGSLPASVISNWEPWSQFTGELSSTDWAGDEDLDLSDQFVVLYLGNAGFGHRFETVLDAAEILRDEPVVFLFVGGGKKWQELGDQKKDRQLENLHLLPYVPKESTPAVMAQADCALITLNASALGVISPSKLHSNLAMHLPVIYVGPEGGNVDQAIKRFNCGVSLRHGDVDQLVNFVRLLRADLEQLSQFRHNARTAFEQAYNDRVALPRFDDILASMAGSKR